MPFRTIEVSLPEFAPAGVSFVTVKSSALKRRADLSLYVPPSSPMGPLPLVILLHGVYGSHWAWLFKGGAHRVLDRLIAEENLPPMMLAMPSDGLWGDGSGYAQHAEADYHRWIVEEVPTAATLVDPRVARAPRFIAGLSMGGYGAMRLGALHPEKFAAISAHSSCTDIAHMQGFVEETSAQFVLTEKEPLSVIECLKKNVSLLPPLRFDCGSDDILIEHNRTLHQQLDREGIPHVYEEFSGGHTWEYWHAHLVDSLRFFGKTLG
ncbi:enterochelin esterase-like enzyme [Prosthecobacter fusiformis]|uniref:Enterochelin esterase-like enzyme n=1 Tax=Prosthecobacter fusiformis TaxID=48464 RepID=A0A4R7SUC0_9BACT|nr:alpha/beta hydrolase-fold protein [Prosthecobacter fusiformis]TDU81888.1 enterochelin esterase-like enzyme [Prosthecobacter fusiformis]